MHLPTMAIWHTKKTSISTCNAVILFLNFESWLKVLSSYLSCHSIKNCNDAWQTATKSNSDQTCQNNTKDGKEDVKCEENHRQPAQIQNQISYFYLEVASYLDILLEIRVKSLVVLEVLKIVLSLYTDPIASFSAVKREGGFSIRL